MQGLIRWQLHTFLPHVLDIHELLSALYMCLIHQHPSVCMAHVEYAQAQEVLFLSCLVLILLISGCSLDNMEKNIGSTKSRVELIEISMDSEIKFPSLSDRYITFNNDGISTYTILIQKILNK